MNPLICNGIAVEQIKFAEEYLDKVLRSASVSFPEELTYVGYQRCTPYEEFGEETKERYSKRQYDIAHSDFYMVKYHFEFKGERLPPRYMYIPFLDDAGLFKVRGSQFVVNPVITDLLFSVDYEKIFMPITRDKLTFERRTHSLMTTDGRISPSFAWSHIHHLASNRTSFRTNVGYTVKPLSTLAHYLFAKCGLTETYKRYFGIDVVVGSSEITEDTYHPNEWIICQSVGVQPMSVKGKGWQPPELKLAIPRSQYRQEIEPLLAATFYLTDLFPDRVKAEWVDEITLWRILLGHVIYKSNESEGKLLEDINHHIQSLDEYIDSLVQESLDEAGVPATDIYELFAYIIENMTKMVIEADVSSLYNKRLTVLRYLLLQAVVGIFKFTFNLKRRAGTINRELRKDDVIKLMDKTLKPTAAVGNITSKHGEVNSMSYPGDNKVPKITSRVILQSLATGTQQQSGLLKDPSKYLHSSLAEVGSFGNQPKFDPTGQSRINPYLPLGVDGTIRQGTRHKELLEDVQRRIERK
jgi:hypothetical protein